MATIAIIEENDLRKLLKGSIVEVLNLQQTKAVEKVLTPPEEPLLSRRQMAAELNVSFQAYRLLPHH